MTCRLWVMLTVFFLGAPDDVQSMDVSGQQTTDTTRSETTVSDNISSKAHLWGLSQKEFERYHTLNQGPLASWNPNLDPLMVLGMFATSEAEQRQYAERYAVQEHMLTVRTLSFERAFREAFQRLFPQEEIISSALMQEYHDRQAKLESSRSKKSSAASLRADDKVIYVVDQFCRSCKQDLEYLRRFLLLSNDGMAEVRVVGLISDEALARWQRQYASNLSPFSRSRLRFTHASAKGGRQKPNTTSPLGFFVEKEGGAVPIDYPRQFDALFRLHDR